MATAVKIKTEASYNGHNVKKNLSVDLNVIAPYSMLTNYIQLVQLLNENIDVICKIGADKKPIKLGSFGLNALNIDRDGEAKIKLNSMIEHVEVDNLNKLAERNDEPLKLMFSAEIEEDDEEAAETNEEESE